MSTHSPQLEALLAQIDALSTLEKVRLVEAAMTKVAQELKEGEQKQPKRSLLGIWKGSGVSEEDIAEVRRELMRNFPREDI